jgi:hypothetical protein
MEEGVTYYIRVRYRGTKYGYSSWSNVIRVSTLVPWNTLINSDNSVHVNIGVSRVSGSWYWCYHRVTIYSNPFMENFDVVDVKSYLEHVPPMELFW